MARKNQAAVATVDNSAAVEKYRALIDGIPSQGGDGFGIIENVINVDSMEALMKSQEQTTLPSVGRDDSLLGVTHVVNAVAKLDSKYENQDVYLIVAAVDPDGDEYRFSVGAGEPMAKLAMLHKFQAFPAQVRFDKAAKPTANNYYPINCTIVAYTDRKTVDA